MVQPPNSADVDRRVRLALAAIRRDPDARRAVEVAGRHASDRLADESQWRRDRVESSDAVADSRIPDSPWLTARQGDRTSERLRERHTATRPRDGDYLGRDVDPDDPRAVDDARHEAWQSHFADTFGLDFDDLEMDAARDHGYGIDGPEFHYRSPDLDDLVPDQRGTDTQGWSR